MKEKDWLELKQGIIDTCVDRLFERFDYEWNMITPDDIREETSRILKDLEPELKEFIRNKIKNLFEENKEDYFKLLDKALS